MNTYTRRLFKLNSGLFFVALGIAMTIKAHIGYGPWEVFHAGLAKTFGISMGMASILDGLLIAVIVVLAKEKIGIGTILNMIMIGLWIDLILPLLKEQQNMRDGIIFLLMGLFVISYGLYFYMSAGLGAGPCDSLMVAITKRTKAPIGPCRGSMEVAAVILGWSLGGMIGPGTVITALGFGITIQVTFKLLKFDATHIKHETIRDTYRFVKTTRAK